MGGDSLLAMQLVSRIEERWHITVEPHLFFENPTIAQIAKVIDNEITKQTTEERKQAKGSQQLRTITPQTRPQHIPLSYAQQRLWFLDQLVPNNPFYNLSAALYLHGHLVEDALEAAINKLIERHEILRTTFPSSTEGEPCQEIHPASPQILTIRDLTKINKKEQEKQVKFLADTEAHRPFNLVAGPLMRCDLLRLSSEEHVLLTTVHHIIADGWSLQIFAEELGSIYNAEITGESIRLAEPALQYADYSLWQLKHDTAESLTSHLNYWQTQLQNAPVLLNLPTDKKRPAVASYNGARMECRLGKKLSKKLKALSQQSHSSLYMILLSAFNVLLYRYTGQKDIIVGSPVANRTKPEIENLIGFFVNTLALRTPD